MKVILILLGVSVIAVSGFELDGFRVTYGPMKNITEFYFEIPRTIDGAVAAGWSCAERPPGPLKQLSLYCSPGRHVCALYAPSGFIGGLQLAFPKDDFYAGVIDIKKWFTPWTVPATDCEPERKYWTISQYYVSEKTLKAGHGPQAIKGLTLQDKGVWVYNHSGELMLIPLTEAKIKSRTLFTKQNCTPRMGTHYHYNMTREMLCENQLPWFALTIKGKLIGSGLQLFGDVTKPTKYRNWFERFQTSTVEKAAVPHGPDCLYKHADIYPIFSLHIYYLDDPEKIKCRLSDSADPSTLISGY